MVNSEGLFTTKGNTIPNNSYNTSVGATALKLEDQFETMPEAQQSIANEQETIVQSETSLDLTPTK